VNRFLPVLLLSLLIAGGGGGGGCQRSEDKLQQAGNSVNSWEATLALTESQFNDHQVPAKFVDQLADAAEKSVEEQSQSVQKSKDLDGSHKQELIARADVVREHARRLKAAASGKGASPP
jgi:hypothetical protein